MIKSIFIPASGTQTDGSVFAAALAVAKPLAAHLEFYHLRLSVYEAAMRSPHAQFCAASVISDALDLLQRQDEHLSAVAVKHFIEFCAANKVAVREVPAAIDEVSANWVEETDHAEKRLMFHARHSDLVVLGRPHGSYLMPHSLIELLLVGSGRPVLIAPDSTATTVTGTVVVGWTETPEATRATAAAMPLLKKAERVVLVSVEEDSATSIGALQHLAQQLKWQGIAAEVHFIHNKSKPATVQLIKAAEELHADLLVVGGYGHKPLREAVCGGVTRSLIEGSDLPVFMMH